MYKVLLLVILLIFVHFQLSKQMGGVVKGLDKVMQSMDLEKVIIAIGH